MTDGEESLDRPKPVGCSSLSGKHRAMQVNALNRVAVITWIKREGGHARVSRDGIALWRAHCTRLRHAYVTDWVVLLNGEFLVVPEDSFYQSFRVSAGPAPRVRRRKVPVPA